MFSKGDNGQGMCFRLKTEGVGMDTNEGWEEWDLGEVEDGIIVCRWYKDFLSQLDEGIYWGKGGFNVWLYTGQARGQLPGACSPWVQLISVFPHVQKTKFSLEEGEG